MSDIDRRVAERFFRKRQMSDLPKILRRYAVSQPDSQLRDVLNEAAASIESLTQSWDTASQACNRVADERDRAIEREAVMRGALNYVRDSLGNKRREAVARSGPISLSWEYSTNLDTYIQAALSPDAGAGMVEALREIAAPKPGMHWSDTIRLHESIAKRALAGVGV